MDVSRKIVINRFNVERWCNDAKEKINHCHKNNITPILVGGTGMYIDKLINGIIDIPSIPESLKLESEILIEKKGLKNFYNLIEEFDPIALKKLIQMIKID